AVGRIADITADKHMEGVRLTRWLLSPIPTFRLWRRMKLWELRSYEQVIKLEQDRLIYQARLQARFGRAWRRKAPVEALMPLRLAKYGVPLAETAAAGLAAAGVEPVLLPPAPATATAAPALEQPRVVQVPEQQGAGQPQAAGAQQQAGAQPQGVMAQQGAMTQQGSMAEQGAAGQAQPLPQPAPVNHESPWFDAPQVSPEAYEGTYNPSIVEGLEPTPVAVPHGPEDVPPPGPEEFQPYPEYVDEALSAEGFAEAAYKAMWDYVEEKQDFPNAEQLDIWLSDMYKITHPRSASILRELTPRLRERIQQEWAENNTP
ncbi:DUF2637 domain-containing protein, partial [Streptomyces sp. NPDC006339]|uniref:DUF2637 domain-containing protein n=1 Tax=Streptomyces sp. NPDC006339 TaxID=3156755 RepID=UPI00339EEDB0